MFKKHIYSFKMLVLSALVLSLASCQQVLDQQPQTAVPSAIADASSARASLLGCYDNLQSANYYGTRMILLPDLHGGNLRHTGTFPSFADFANRTHFPSNAEVTNMWIQIYNGILRCNFVISSVPSISPTGFADKDQLVAEAQLIRAFHYFNLVRYWGDVPLVLEPTTKADATLQVPRSTVTDVYKQINADIDAAFSKLPATNSVGRVTRNAAMAFKARVALYQRDWNGVLTAAAQVTGRTLAASTAGVFTTKNSTESIWELQFNTTDQSGLAFFLLSSGLGGRNEVRPSTQLIGLYGAADNRRMLATSFDQQIKYYRIASQDDNVVLFRLAEVILNRAEALVELNRLEDALVLLNQIRVRAGLAASPASLASDQTALRNEIFLQRRLELALEGHYFFDLVRTGRAATELANWRATQALLPIPEREINANPKLVQNSGY
jgi:starch-binding outer membrane protein, SusD/RagB family